MKNLVFVVGARPNFMKVAPILRELERRDRGFSRALVHTGQHYDAGMSEVFFDDLAIPPPDAYLEIGSGTHGAQTGRVMEAFEAYLLGLAEPPRGVVVVGDVNSTMAAALVAAKLGVDVAHVEAGLRSFDRTMPEEINRVVTDAVASLLLVSEPSGVENLRREGAPEQRVHLVGNVMIDTLVRELPQARGLDAPGALGLERGRYAAVTLHRPANVDDRARLEALVELLSWLGERIRVAFPVHPRTAKQLDRTGLRGRLAAADGVMLLDPLGYRKNLGLMEGAGLLITDSGGIQEEAAYLGVPCLTIRPNTERPVTVTLGTNTLVTGDLAPARKLVEAILEGRYKKGQPIPLWEGETAPRICDVLADAWS